MYVPKRFIFAFLGFLGFVNIYAMRNCLGMVMVAMVNETAPSMNSSNHQIIECPNIAGNKSEAKIVFSGRVYNWDSKQQATILGSFYYGYILAQIPSGILTSKFSVKWLFGFSILITSLLSMLIPIGVGWGVPAFITFRVLIGLAQGLSYPAIIFGISFWSPKVERSRMTSFILTGADTGNVVAMLASGLLSSTDILGGWPSVFYLFGSFGCLWFLFWCYFIYELPVVHPYISQDELSLIQKDRSELIEKKSDIPWKCIFTSIPMYALVFAHFGYDFGFLILVTKLPMYLSEVLHFKLKSNALLSALPFVALIITAWSVAIAADKLRIGRKLSISTIRKMFNSIGTFGPALCLIGVTFSGCQHDVIVPLLTLAMAFVGFVFSGFHVTHMDMCPDHAGTLYAITHTISNTPGILGPMMVAFFTEDGATIANWNKVFYVAAGVYIVTGLIYAILGSADLQSWGTNKNLKKQLDALDMETMR